MTEKVTMVVPVLMTSCQSSEKWKTGPSAPHTRTVASAAQNAVGEPAHRVTLLAKRIRAQLSFALCLDQRGVAALNQSGQSA